MRFVFLAALCLLSASAQTLPTAERWRDHLTNDLMKFWMHPDAQGQPRGAFPSTRCDDGAAVNWARPCPEVGGNAWLMQRQRYLVAQSRQVYAYGVAYHVTGETRYLDLMKAGVDFIRANAVDRARGGLFTLQEANGVWGPRMEFRNPQELAYGLLGLSMYYYLTRDPAVLPDILSARDHILGNYYRPELGALGWVLQQNGNERPDDRRLVAQLDQLNAYTILMIPVLPEPYQSEWKQAVTVISRLMIERFYSPSENLFFLSANTPADLDLARSATDFGHTIKAMWMIRFTGRLTGDRELIDFAERNGPRVLERAYHADSGSWASGVLAGGAVDLDKSWWIYAELDQFASSLALTDPAHERFLERTYPYWLERFVDTRFGEVWTTVDGVTHRPKAGDLPKAWPWKNGYHSTEHALVAYLHALVREQKPVQLYYAFVDAPRVIQPYFYEGEIAAWDDFGDGRQRVMFTGVR